MVPDGVFTRLRMLLGLGLVLTPAATGKHWLETEEAGRIKRFYLNLVVLMIQFSKSDKTIWAGRAMNKLRLCKSQRAKFMVIRKKFLLD